MPTSSKLTMLGAQPCTLEPRSNGNPAVVRCLVKEFGAAVNVGNQAGATPLFIAAQEGHLVVMRRLVKDLHADVSIATHDGWTLLVISAQKGHKAVVRCLIKEFGVDVNQADQKGYTPLYLAAQEGHLAVVRCLAKQIGTDVNQAIHDGTTPLSIAPQNGHLSVLRCLIEELGADINQPKHREATPFMIAAKMGYQNDVAYLLKRGANSQASLPASGVALDIVKADGAPAKLITYLEAKTHCSNLACAGAGIKKCTGCKQARYCGQTCQLAHRKAHKVECKRAAKDKDAKNCQRRLYPISMVFTEERG